MRLVAGIDSSTQSTKIELRDLNGGDVIASGREDHPPTTPPVSEQDPMDWWRALSGACHQVARHLDRVVAVSVAGQQHGLVIVDDRAEVIRPAKLWNDTTSAPQARRLVEQLGPEAWIQACGLMPVASFTLTKLAWLAENEPESLERVALIMLPHDYLTWKLTGAHVTDRGDASGTAWWSPYTNSYSPDLLGLVVDANRWIDRLPRVLDPREPAGEVTQAASAATGLPAGVPVAAGSGDNMSAALGLGLEPGDVAISLGTSGTAYTVANHPVTDLSGTVAGFASADGRYLPLVATLNATKVTDAVATWLGVDRDVLARMALGAEVDPDLVMLPYLDGERTPNLPAASGTITGLRTGTTRESIAAAAHAGVVCGLLDAIDALESCGLDTTRQIYLVGGGAKSPAYRQIAADLMDRPVAIPDADELVAAGACLQAARMLTQLNGEPDPEWDASAGVIVEPRPDREFRQVRRAYQVQASRYLETQSESRIPR